MAKLLHQCSANSHGIHIECLSQDLGQHDTFLDIDKRCIARSSSGDVNVQDTYIVSGKKCIAMETVHIMDCYKVLLLEWGY